MIIRKPYAFIIKNFRLIHLFMLIVSAYILYKTGVMLSFTNDYVSTREVLQDITVNDYIPGLLFFASFIMLILSVPIYVLFKKKQKPVTFYLLHIIYYIVFIIFCIISSRLPLAIIDGGIDPRIARLFRDFWLINAIIQVAFLVVILIRTIGFDFKKFNFGEDLLQIQIEEKDNEEVEINTEFNTEKAKMKVAMQKEELKSFFYEYKLIIIIILTVLFVITPAALIANKIISSKIYTMNEPLKIKEIDLKVTDAYITKKNYSDDILYKGENNFLIVKIKVKNNTSNEYTMVLNNLRLQIGDNYYLPVTKYNDQFRDIGTCYTDQKITSTEKEYIVIYTVTNEMLGNEVLLRYASSLKYDNKTGKIDGKYYRIKLELTNIDSETINHNYSLTDSMDFTGSYLKNTTLAINNYDVLEYYVYKVDNVDKYIINNTGLLLKLNYAFKTDDKNLSLTSLLTKYGEFTYTINGRTYSTDIKFANAKGYNSNDLFILVSENIKDASAINLVLKLRNNIYTYKIK